MSAAAYVARIERGGVEVYVSIDLDAAAAAYKDVDELSEVASMAATRVSTSVHESILRATLNDPF